jgi:integrase
MAVQKAPFRFFYSKVLTLTDQYPDSTATDPLRNVEHAIQAADESKALQNYLHAATSDNTRRAYRSAIRQFEKWGGRLPTDQHTVIRYILAKAEVLNSRTLDLHLTAIAQWHSYQGIRNPVCEPIVRKAMEGIRRSHGRPKKKAKALRLEHIARMVGHLRQQPESNKRSRDSAIILTGFFGAFRRSELVTIQVQDLTWEPEGLIIHLPRSKTDQESAGLTRALPFGAEDVCPGTAIKIWIKQSQLSEGPLFRPINRWDHVGDKALSPGAINDLLKRRGEACGFDFVPELSSHSFRRGLSTSAARERVSFDLIKKQGGWKNDATVWGYIEEGQQLTDNASSPLMDRLHNLISRYPE